MRLVPASLAAAALMLAGLAFGLPAVEAADGIVTVQMQAAPALAVPMPSAQLAPVPMPPGPDGLLPPPLPVLSPATVRHEADMLKAALAREVPRLVSFPPARRQALIGGAQAVLAASDGSLRIDRAQVVLVVDRNPRVQELALVLARPDAPWEVLGGVHVSTGQSGRKYYYITPTGVFMHTADILDYRAEGTFNENHIRGIGLKGMRVWDFGWQWAHKGWQGNGDWGQIRLEMHATDPEFLESRLGRPASEGCVRIPAAMNVFLDRHGVLDMDYEQQAVQDVRYRALLSSQRSPTPLAGHAMIVMDSSLPQ